MTALTFTPCLNYNFRMSSILSDLSVAQLKRAVAIKEQIEELETELSSILEESPNAAPSAAPIEAPKKRTMSPAARAKISAAQKARWAKERGETAFKVSPEPAATKPEKALKADGRATISTGPKVRGRGRKATQPLNSVMSKPKRNISAAGRARMIAATKARWARYNAAKKAR
jgi:hypothetical protein